MPGFWKTLKKSLADSYDYLGLVLASSFVWFSTALGGFAVVSKIGRLESPLMPLLGMAALYLLLIAPMTAGVYSLARTIVIRDDPSLLDLLWGARKLFVPSMTLAFAQLIVTAMIVANAWFYLTHGGILLRMLGVVFLYILLVWALSATYHYPLLIEQRPGVLKILKRGLLLAMDNVAFTAGVFFVIILLTCFSGVTLLGLPLLYMGVLSILQTRALRALFVKYELLPPEREYVPDEETAVQGK